MKKLMVKTALMVLLGSFEAAADHYGDDNKDKTSGANGSAGVEMFQNKFIKLSPNIHSDLGKSLDTLIDFCLKLEEWRKELSDAKDRSTIDDFLKRLSKACSKLVKAHIILQPHWNTEQSGGVTTTPNLAFSVYDDADLKTATNSSIQLYSKIFSDASESLEVLNDLFPHMDKWRNESNNEGFRNTIQKSLEQLKGTYLQLAKACVALQPLENTKKVRDLMLNFSIFLSVYSDADVNVATEAFLKLLPNISSDVNGLLVELNGLCSHIEKWRNEPDNVDYKDNLENFLKQLKEVCRKLGKLDITLQSPKNAWRLNNIALDFCEVCYALTKLRDPFIKQRRLPVDPENKRSRITWRATLLTELDKTKIPTLPPLAESMINTHEMNLIADINRMRVPVPPLDVEAAKVIWRAVNISTDKTKTQAQIRSAIKELESSRDISFYEQLLPAYHLLDSAICIVARFCRLLNTVFLTDINYTVQITGKEHQTEVSTSPFAQVSTMAKSDTDMIVDIRNWQILHDANFVIRSTVADLNNYVFWPPSTTFHSDESIILQKLQSRLMDEVVSSDKVVNDMRDAMIYEIAMLIQVANKEISFDEYIKKYPSNNSNNLIHIARTAAT
ncbi:MAG: hypothetical protein LBB63_04380 [Holosporaceae bacterium]|nr:hypothetical protein [Holosporaceae bacterium]